MRSLSLARDLRAAGDEACVWFCGDRAAEAADFARRAFSPDGLSPALFTGEAAARGGAWDLVIFDRFYAPRREYAAFARAPIIALDESGPLRRRADFLLDLLPSLKSRAPANDTRPDLLPLPRARRAAFPAAPDFAEGGLRVVVSFGGEDAAGLGRAAAARLARALPKAAVTLVSPGGAPAGAAFRAVPYMPALREALAGFDLVVTHFGLTAFEAAYARCAVALVSPSRLHERLARAAGFFSCGRGTGGARRLGRLARRRTFFRAVTDATAAAAARHGLARVPPETSLARYIHDLDIYTFRICPVCGRDTGPRLKIAARFPRQTFAACPRCGMLFQQRFAAPPAEYEESYFFEMYKNQYGRTYLEDFPALVAAAKQRLARVRRVCRAGAGAALLDIGCAHGAFLSAARDDGWRVLGIDPSAAAVRYAQTALNLPARAARVEDDLPPDAFPPASFDCVTMWYVIEHLARVPAALEKARALLKPGGVFAFSTPSASGISALKSRRAFLEKSPGDHWSIWKPRRVRALLRRAGFTVRQIRITGHHPERFPLCGRFAKPGGFLYAALAAISRLLRLGDTFEVYAVKSP